MVSVELRSHPGCPLIEQTRAVLRECLDRTGSTATVTERIGAHPSPTVLVDGIDVMGDPGLDPGITACRMDVPTRTALTAALIRTHSGD